MQLWIHAMAIPHLQVMNTPHELEIRFQGNPDNADGEQKKIIAKALWQFALIQEINVCQILDKKKGLGKHYITYHEIKAAGKAAVLSFDGNFNYYLNLLSHPPVDSKFKKAFEKKICAFCEVLHLTKDNFSEYTN